MSIGKLLRSSVLLIVLPAAVFPPFGLAEPAVVPSPSIIRHDLTVDLDPASHALIARDLVEVEVPREAVDLVFTLASSLHVESILLQAQSETSVSFSVERPERASTQRIVVQLPPIDGGRAALVWAYRGVVNDPPKEPRHLRFVTPSETAGHIGPEGVYLSSESQWYPDIEGSLSAFRVSADVPTGWTVVTQGKQIDEATREGRSRYTWIVTDRSEALTLVANRFTVTSREWRGRNGQRIELATYFFADNAGLADEYLAATAKYLTAYVPLLGDYPFEKFAVVENFFASGLGMPSFTLLGSGSIKRHYVQPYALGHEIVHSWIGNSVFNRAGHGNWVEGLTTYLANYYWHELAQDDAQAREQRRLMIHSYSLYVTPEEDYPVAEFMRKSDEKDNAIGYQKAAFVFHLLRAEIGEDKFWSALKQFVSRFRNRAADWGSLESVFSQVSGQDLRWFFRQWVEQGGAPVVELRQAAAAAVSGGAGSEGWRLAVDVRQQGKPFRMQIPLEIAMEGSSDTRWVSVSRPEDRAEVVLPHRPFEVRLDPDWMVFRRLSRSELPPMLNGFVTDRRQTVIKAFSDAASPLSRIPARLMDQAAHEQGDSRTVVLSIGEPIPATGSILILAEAEQRQATQSLIRESCGDRVALEENGFQIDGQRHAGPAMAVLVSCRRAGVPGSVLSVLYGITPQAVANVSRLLFYYGWHSVVVFQDGAVVRRDVWEASPNQKEVQVHANR